MVKSNNNPVVKFYKIFLSFVVLLDFVAMGQTGPGGVRTSSSNKIWFKANAITSLSDGQGVATWIDQSTNGNDATHSTVGFEPLYKPK